MSLSQRLAKLFGGEREDADVLRVYVRCRRCGEAISTRISLRNELSIRYDESGQVSGYHVRKVLIGSKRRCYQPIEVHLTFDAQKHLLEREIGGGEFITAEEYAAETG
ncbi:MAG: hypothetical protein QHJ81_15835 [Anaerolineae bacterium]|nr:hypothetical protein [Anaerolineae bacterium]